jgi:dienelactone hydrolase
MTKYLLTLTLIFTTTILFSQITLDTLRYKDGNTHCIGYVAKPKKITKNTKTIIIVHEWWGLNEYPKSRAKQLAELGFIACCIDMYGNGAVAATPEQAKAQATPFYANPELSYERFMAGYNAIIADKQVNPALVAAIGYCFGGSVCLNAAKMGAPVDAVVSFHGSLGGVPVDKTKMKAAVLVCHGGDDKFVSNEEVEAFKKDMEANDVDYKFIVFPGATHAFTNPNATETGKKFNMPISYNELADKRSFDAFLKFIAKKVK